MKAFNNSDKYENVKLFFSDVISLNISAEFDSSTEEDGPDSKYQHPNDFEEDSSAFVFKNGSIVFWNVSKKQISSFLNFIKPYEKGSIQNQELEVMDYSYCEKESSPSHILSDTIKLSQSRVLYDKLAFSHGLSHSVKLAIIEQKVDNHVSSLKEIPTSLATNYSIFKSGPSRSEVLIKLSTTLQLRSILNLDSDLTESPDFYWSEPLLEDTFISISRALEIRQRVSVLNRKLDYANQLLQIIYSHLSQKHSLKLEWLIIALIAVEVLFECVHYTEKKKLNT